MTNIETLPQRRFKKASLRDLAREAEVSVTTVSRYTGGRTDICSADTARRIESAMKKLHYTPNALERGMRLGVTQVIGASTMPPSESTFTDRQTAFSLRLWHGISMMADEKHLTLLSYPKSVRNASDVRPFLDGRIDGVLLSSAINDPRPEKIARAGMPIVLIDRSHDLPDGCGAAFADESSTANLAMTHLWDMGHRRIAHIAVRVAGSASAVPQGSGIAVGRHQGYISWMTQRGLYDPALIGLASNWEGLGVEGAVNRLYRLSDPPTAIFCASDMIALKAIDTLRSMGRNVPADVSVIGVDNLRIDNPAYPTLTSVDVPVEEIGRSAMKALVALLGGASALDCRFFIPVTCLVNGATVAPLHGR